MRKCAALVAEARNQVGDLQKWIAGLRRGSSLPRAADRLCAKARLLEEQAEQKAAALRAEASQRSDAPRVAETTPSPCVSSP